MTYSPIQLDIIRTFGSKELSEGCFIQESTRLLKIVYETGIKYSPYFCIDLTEKQLSPQCGFNPSDYENAEILGHIPHLFPDVARVAEEKGKHMEVRTMIYDRIEFSVKENPYPICIPYNPTLPLIDQEESTLLELLTLFK